MFASQILSLGTLPGSVGLPFAFVFSSLDKTPIWVSRLSFYVGFSWVGETRTTTITPPYLDRDRHKYFRASWYHGHDIGSPFQSLGLSSDTSRMLVQVRSLRAIDVDELG